MSDVKRYTLAEVAEHDGSKGHYDIWMVYKDSVYDLANYVDKHPAGYESIIEEAGKDATKAFDDVGHSAESRVELAEYKIGELVEEEKRYDANGKKKKRVVDAPPEKTNNARSFCNIITCGLVG